jgi:hypothetical protein
LRYPYRKESKKNHEAQPLTNPMLKEEIEKKINYEKDPKQKKNSNKKNNDQIRYKN